ncbi:hypothetical protein SLG_16740 [Sphingobium sp. SYK-6]|uniref:hypothetical protein n=1 Tax=Sphingobium sp. (strain NBRC 103272 / SYK-6) TaxID=627192 RepID=UPI0002277084|nr:hypothetical protein [Sphingobium sp. SYK-6]BAK66349.1 hypothetical protein SLG_16740 [Sphingobium sp. SYK-6]
MFRKLLAGLLVLAQGAPALALADADPAPYLAKLDSEGDRNRVLNQMEIGTRYFWSQDFQGAGRSFDDCIQNIELVFLNDPSVVKARSLWYEEGAKTFKGEPYERAMVYYYRGLVFLAQGDYENARAAFRQGTFQDAFAEEEQNQADFAVLYFLEAWASHLNGDKDLRDEALAKVHALRPDFPGIGESDDTLALVETGTAPRKLGDGLDHSYFVFRRGKGFTENRAELVTAGEQLPLYAMEDVYRQAATRGGREIDQIIKGQVKFKRAANDVGSTLTDTAQVVSALGGDGTVSGALAGVGALASILSGKAKVKADTRTWSSLPDRVHVSTFASGKLGMQDLAVQFLTDGTPTDQPAQQLITIKDPRGRQLALARSR